MVARKVKRGQLEMFAVPLRTYVEAATQGEALAALHALCDGRPGACSTWYHASDVADRADRPDQVALVSEALYKLLYKEAVRRREGPQGVQWTIHAAGQDRCCSCGGCGP